MDTSPIQAKPISRLDELTTLLNETLKQIVIELTNSKDQQTDLEKAVDVALHNADWFDQRLEEFVGNHINDMDLDYEIGNQVERYMRNEFDPEDHVDFYDLVSSKVDDVIDDIVSEKVEERLTEILEEKLANANITINF